MSREFRICSLASGSSGNAYYAESADGAVLVDAGVSGKKIRESVARAGGDMDRVRALVITHDHSDHVKSAGVLARRYKIPVFMTEGTWERSRARLGRMETPRFVRGGQTLELAGFRVHTLATPHDGVEPVSLVVERLGVRCGVLTDLGCVFPELADWIATLDAVFLESNYDPDMLARGPYPYWLQQRIRSDGGHIANEEAACLVRDHGGERLQLVMLAHLSENNNHPRLALKSASDALAEPLADGRLALGVAPRHGPSDILVVRPRA